MPFVSLPGVKGMVFTPEKKCREGGQKHPCTDCFSCQMCGDDRCQICRNGRAPRVPIGCGRHAGKSERKETH